MAKSLFNMTDQELLAENERLMAAKEKLRDEQRAIQQVLSSRETERRAARLLEGMTDEQRDVVAKVAAGKAGVKAD